MDTPEALAANTYQKIYYNPLAELRLFGKISPVRQILMRYPFPKDTLPKPGSVEKHSVTGRLYKWSQKILSNTELNWDEKQLEALNSLKEDEYLEIGFEVYWYYTDVPGYGKRAVKLFRSDATPHYVPEDAVKMPNNMELVTSQLSETGVIASAERFIRSIEK